MSLQRSVLIGAALSISFGLGVASSVVISPLPAQAEDFQISQTTSVNEIRTPARVERLVQNEELAEMELLPTGETLAIDISAIPQVRNLSPGDYVIITSDGEPNVDNVISMEEVSEDEANDLLAEIESTETEDTTVESQTSVTRTETTVQTQQQVTPRPAPAPAPRVAPAPAPAPAPVRALW